MKLGVAMLPVHQALRPGELAALAEERGFESLFFPEHTHIPAAQALHSDPARGPLSPNYWNMLDPFVALASAAAATTRIKLGTGICLIPQRDPITTAKAAASLDHLSGGRLLFGVGAGWNRREAENHGVDFDRRFARMREHIEAIKAIWTEDEPSYAGRYVSFEGLRSWPKPVQTPHPPILVGGSGPRVLDRVLAYGDEWLAEPAPGLPDRIAELWRRAADAGRRDTVAVTLYGASPDDVDMWSELGVHRCVFWVDPGALNSVRTALDELAGRLARP